MAISFDCGTYNLVCTTKDEKGNYIHNKEVNAFLEIPLEDKFVFNMMKMAGVALIERNKVAYALGEAAVRMACIMSNFELRRPMKDGCVNPSEKDAFEILNIMIHSLLEGNVKRDKEVLYYSVPSNSISGDTDAEFHKKILQSIFKAYESEEGYIVNANPINEGLALVYAELGKEKRYTGIGVSCGGGMVNVCFAMYGNPVFQFSIVDSGDWIDKQAAKSTGESIAFINQEKMKIDLTKSPSGIIERAIQTQYRIMIEKTVNSIKQGLETVNKKTKTPDGVDIVIAGGTSMPNGFDLVFKEVMNEVGMPIKINSVIRPLDPLYSVSRGCLIAAENAL